MMTRLKVVVFDLDDTLYKEIDFLMSGYREVARLIEKRYGINFEVVYNQLMFWFRHGDNPFVKLNETYGIDNPIEDYLNIYRFHNPAISMSKDTMDTLDKLKSDGMILGIITDGRVITQNNKIESLGLTKWFNKEHIFINEDSSHFKPNHWSFDRMMLSCYGRYHDVDFSFCYIGDNTQKDFLAPNQMGWTTICLLDDGRNIHPQSFDLQKEYLPERTIRSLKELLCNYE